MSSETFNSLSGFSVGIPSVEVIDASGNLITNVFTGGNVKAGAIYSNDYRYANGTPLPIIGGNGVPGGANTQVQYNFDGNFGANPGFTFDSDANLLTTINLNLTGLSNLGSVGNVTILGGTNGYVLGTDGLGNLSWVVGGNGGGGNGTPGGANTYVQFNDEGNFGGVSTFAFDSGNDILYITTIDATDANLTGDIHAANIYLNTVTANSGSFANNVTIGHTLTVNTAGNLRSTGKVNFASSANINFGTVSNIHISGGTNGQVLSTDGLGNLSWATGGNGGGNGTPGGSNTQIQFNDSSDFGGSPYLTFDKDQNKMQIAGELVANSFQMGAGIYRFFNQSVYFATTASTSPNQVLWSIPAANVSGVDFTIVATDVTGNTRQSSKISSVILGDAVAFNEYAGLGINGGVGSFTVQYAAGNIITAASLQLIVTPDSSASTQYNMMITEYINYP